MKNILLNVLHDYLLIFPKEQERQSLVLDYLQKHSDEEITNWNNFDGHIVVGGFIYAKKEHKFLVLYHRDLKMFLYPGGHINKDDSNPLNAVKREIFEETGIKNLEQVKLSKSELIPLDIDTHKIDYNKRLNLPEHYHFEFRYLFTINNILDIKIDTSEISKYKWINIEELSSETKYGKILTKIRSLLSEDK